MDKQLMLSAKSNGSVFQPGRIIGQMGKDHLSSSDTVVGLHPTKKVGIHWSERPWKMMGILVLN